MKRKISNRPLRRSIHQRKTKKSNHLKRGFITVCIWLVGLFNLIIILSLVSEILHSRDQKEDEPQNSTITVEVLNGCGVDLLAKRVSFYLRSKQFDVVSFRNYDGGFNEERTVVYDRTNSDCRNAKRVGEALGMNSVQISPRLDASAMVMVSVILGRDYEDIIHHIKNVQQTGEEINPFF